MIKLFLLAFQTIFQVGLLPVEVQEQLAVIGDEIFAALLVIVTSVIGIFVPILLNTLRQHLALVKSHKQLSLIADYAKMSIAAAQQGITDGSNVQKFEYASKLVADYAKAHKIPFVTQDSVRALIEAGVLALKKDLKQQEEVLKK